MLVLSRKAHQKIVCQLPSGEEIVLMVVRIDSDKCRLGLDAPQDVKILREELIPTTPPPTAA